MIRPIAIMLALTTPAAAETCRLRAGSWADGFSTVASQMAGNVEVGGLSGLGDAAAPVAMVGKYALKCWLVPAIGGNNDDGFLLVDLPGAGAAAWNVGVIAGFSTGGGLFAAVVVMNIYAQSRFNPDTVKYIYPSNERMNDQ